MRRTLLAAWIVVAVLGSTLVATGPAHAALSAPGGLSPSGSAGQPHPVLSWDRVAGAEDYDVQVATDPGFASVLDTVTTANRRFVPPRTLPPESRLWWRVRASDGPTTSAWATATFDTALIGGPTLLAPAHEAVLAQPAQPLLLSWSPVPGATDYALEVDDAQGFPSPVTAADLKTTSYVIRNPGAPTADTDNGTWWRVRANFGRRWTGGR